MGQNEREWEELTAVSFENGADAIELNFSCPHMAEEGLGSDIGQIPELVEHFCACARKGAGSRPLLAKLTPNAASMAPIAGAAIRGGADGIAAINTIKSVTPISSYTHISAPAVHGLSAVGGCSGPAVLPVALRFIAELAKSPAMAGRPISGMGGITTWHDALDVILLGAGTVQVTTAVMQYGCRIIEDLTSGLAYYLDEQALTDVRSLVGAGLPYLSETADVPERDTVVLPRFNRAKCVGCGRCAISCADGGRQAIRFGPDRRPFLDAGKCVGCHLCLLVCPQDAILPAPTRIAKTPAARS